MKQIFAVTFFLILTLTSATAHASGRYLRHPVFHNLPEMEIRAESQLGYGDVGNIPFGLLAAFGVRFQDSWTAGPYIQVMSSDRDLPSRQKHIYGAGILAEYTFSNVSVVYPYVGVRVGFLDPTGPTSKTVPYVGGYVGGKYKLSSRVAITAAVNLHWAGDTDDYKAYNYRRSGSSHKADSYDITLDLGLRYAF